MAGAWVVTGMDRLDELELEMWRIQVWTWACTGCDLVEEIVVRVERPCAPQRVEVLCRDCAKGAPR